MTENISIRELLLHHYLEYQKAIKGRASVKKFAEHIGLSYSFYNHLFNSTRRAGLDTVNQLALFFDDPRFYDAAGFPRPDPLINDLSRVIDQITDSDKKKIHDVIAKYQVKKHNE